MARRRDADPHAFKRLSEAIKRQSYHACYVLHGEEMFLQENIAHQLEKQLIDERTREMDLTRITVNQYNKLDWQQLEETARTPVFFSEKRLIIIKNSGIFTDAGKAHHEDAIRLIQYITDRDDVILLFMEEKVDGRYKKLTDAVKQNGVIVSIDLQDDSTLGAWISGYFSRDRIHITREATESLLSRTGGAMQVLRDEMQKLRHFCLGKRISEIDRSIVDGLCIPDVQGTIFDLTDALGQRNADKAHRLLKALLDQSKDRSFILVMIARHYHQLIIAKDVSQPQAIQKVLSVQPFVARKLIDQSRYYPIERLIGYYEACAETDWLVKSGQMSIDMALDLLCSRLSIEDKRKV